MITCFYEIIAKVLSKWLKGGLHETIYAIRGAFVYERQILDAILIANEIMDEKRCLREEMVVFEIDFEKTYDHMDWGF